MALPMAGGFDDDPLFRLLGRLRWWDDDFGGGIRAGCPDRGDLDAGQGPDRGMETTAVHRGTIKMELLASSA